MTKDANSHPINVDKLLHEYGQAFRGDWSEVDGRSVQLDLDYFSTLLKSPEGRTMEECRSQLGLCTKGLGHWDYNCEYHGCLKGDD